VARARRGFLATADEAGRPHVVPVVFVHQGRRLYIPLDAKSKRVPPLALQRVRNILVNPHVAFLVDRWDEEWGRLAYVLLRGRASLLTQGEDYEEALRALEAKYPQYRTLPLGRPPLIVVEVTRAVAWGDLTGPATEGGGG
jgi:coenzyme F420-0:L-glutamate ligase/coenzyme F420-1:gamma-L-glutamate ligase